jgi:hypothetical protein
MKAEIRYDEMPGYFVAQVASVVATGSTQAEALRELALALERRDGWSRQWRY